ncbi:MAG: hypothetical protein PWP37_248 [Thermotogota bacterium]|nr:hypothetical protein [Thermotogota bacterium]MDK2864056.1 hypothetical protein [Thermotogota bacterium]HCZ06303.1 hypothetical protein [Thermotogota bacterium]
MDYVRYAKAVSTALTEIKIEEPDISDIWIVTSIPEDLIRELFEKGMVDVPDNIRKIVDRRKHRTLYERKD